MSLRKASEVITDLENISDEIEQEIEGAGIYEGRICCLLSDLDSAINEIAEITEKDEA